MAVRIRTIVIISLTLLCKCGNHQAWSKESTIKSRVLSGNYERGWRDLVLTHLDGSSSKKPSSFGYLCFPSGHNGQHYRDRYDTH
jgi:hypothetical protein